MQSHLCPSTLHNCLSINEYASYNKVTPNLNVCAARTRHRSPLPSREPSHTVQQLSRNCHRTQTPSGGSTLSDTDADSVAEAPSRTWLTVRFNDPLAPPACARVQPLSSRHALPLRLR